MNKSKWFCFIGIMYHRRNTVFPIYINNIPLNILNEIDINVGNSSLNQNSSETWCPVKAGFAFWIGIGRNKQWLGLAGV